MGSYYLLTIIELQNITTINDNRANLEYNHEIPDYFEEWLKLANEKFTNIISIRCINCNLTSITIHNKCNLYCSNNKITSINGPNLRKLICDDNKLVNLYLPKVKYISANNNLLENIYAPLAEEVYCCDNNIEELILENATLIYCPDNKLTNINAPKVTHISAHNNLFTFFEHPSIMSLNISNNKHLQYINCPIVLRIICDNMPKLEYIFAPKLQVLKYGQYNENNEIIRIPLHDDIKLYDHEYYPINFEYIKNKLNSIYSMVKSSRNC